MTGALALQEYQFILLPIALGLLFPTLIMPWIVINFRGVSGVTPLDLLWRSYELGGNDSDNKDFAASSREHPELVFLDLVASYNIHGLYASWIVAYVASLIAIVLSIILKRMRSRIALIAGILAIITAIIWFYSIEVLKSAFAEQAEMTGGVIGEEFRGNERALIDSILGMGFGPYVVIPAGAVAILFYFLQHHRKEE